MKELDARIEDLEKRLREKSVQRAADEALAAIAAASAFESLPNDMLVR